MGVYEAAYSSAWADDFLRALNRTMESFTVSYRVRNVAAIATNQITKDSLLINTRSALLNMRSNRGGRYVGRSRAFVSTEVGDQKYLEDVNTTGTGPKQSKRAPSNNRK